ncbi:MAG: MurR/RpiR family transcriptional regulator [Deltaproteobacteria bacterium]|nr:MurR/RpiR family transcriptional regulator [Deltaproteobacteria bacterium]
MAKSTARTEFFTRILQAYPTLPKKRKLVADLILNDYKKIFLYSAKEIAQECGVSEPTITRFAMDLGFAGFAEFEAYLKGLLHIELNSVERMVRASQTATPQEEHTLLRYCQNTIDCCRKLMTSISAQDFHNLARTIKDAEEVVVLGYRAAASLAQFFGYLLKKVRGKVLIDTTCSWEANDLIAVGNSSIVVVAIAFPRYSQRILETLKFARQFGCKTIGISDTLVSPVIAGTDLHAVIDVVGLSFVDPFAPVVTFLEALIHEIAFLDKTATLDRLGSIEKGLKAAREFYSEENSDVQKGLQTLTDEPLGVEFYRQRK